MNEAEALTKWCPFVRTILNFGTDNRPVLVGPFNRDTILRSESDIGSHIDRSRCIASACMAWRQTANVIDPNNPGGFGVVNSVPAGFCGLAGQP